jgi:hypothetical protein
MKSCSHCGQTMGDGQLRSVQRQGLKPTGFRAAVGG